MITQRTTPPAHDPSSWSMLDRLARGVVSPLANLRDAIDLTLEQVADWVADARNRRRINNLLMLLNVQAQLLLSEHRLLAAERLLDVINDPKAAPETVRRACSDLLKTNLVDLVELRRSQVWPGESEEPQANTAHRAVAHSSVEPPCATAVPAVAPRATPQAAHQGAGRMPAPQSHTGKGKPAAAAHREFKAAMLTHGLAPPASSSVASGGEPSGLHSGGGAMFIANHGEGGSLNGDVLKQRPRGSASVRGQIESSKPIAQNCVARADFLLA